MTTGGEYLAAGVGQAILGFRADLIVIDEGYTDYPSLAQSEASNRKHAWTTDGANAPPMSTALSIPRWNKSAVASPAIPIGPHWMIIWPYGAKRCGLPNTVRDAGAWVMFDGTPYAYLHVCGTPWDGNEYRPGQVPIWTMRYGSPLEP